jgi:hypothetical protein
MAVRTMINGGLTGGGLDVQVELRANRPCLFNQMPYVAVLQADGAVVTDAIGYQRASGPPVVTAPIDEPLSHPVMVEEGETVEISSYWYDVCAPVKPPFHVRVRLGEGTAQTLRPPPYLSGDQGGPGPPMCLSSETPGRRLPSGTLLLGPLHVSAEARTRNSTP